MKRVFPPFSFLSLLISIANVAGIKTNPPCCQRLVRALPNCIISSQCHHRQAKGKDNIIRFLFLSQYTKPRRHFNPSADVSLFPEKEKIIHFECYGCMSVWMGVMGMGCWLSVSIYFAISIHWQINTLMRLLSFR